MPNSVHGAPPTPTARSLNGAPPTGKPLSQLLLTLGIERSHSRPHTSNDNPFSAAQFKTMKYWSDYPDRFASFAEAQAWTAEFITHYHESHYQSGLKLFTPSSVHDGEWTAQHAQRQAVLDVRRGICAVPCALRAGSSASTDRTGGSLAQSAKSTFLRNCR
jgi:putative transposase